MATPRKNREDLLINYPEKRAVYGTKLRAAKGARALGAKTFPWDCPKHGAQVPHTTASKFGCQRCAHDAIKALRARRRAERAAQSIATALERELVGKMAGHALLTQRTDDPVSVYLHAIAAKHAQRA